MYVPPCFAIVLDILRESLRHISRLPALPKSTTSTSLKLSSSGLASLAARRVEWKRASVSCHGMVESLSACTKTRLNLEQVPRLSSATENSAPASYDNVTWRDEVHHRKLTQLTRHGRKSIVGTPCTDHSLREPFLKRRENPDWRQHWNYSANRVR